jgi:hypothetical protein
LIATSSMNASVRLTFIGGSPLALIQFIARMICQSSNACQ